jgi:PEP-CTERM motif
MKTQTTLCAAAIALLSTSLAAALAPQTARADVTTTFDVSGTATAELGQSCGSNCPFSGTLTIDVTTGAATAVDITFPGLSAFDTLTFSDGAGPSDWAIFASNSAFADFVTLIFTTTQTPGSLVGFAGGSIVGKSVSGNPSGNVLYALTSGSIAAVPEPSTWALAIIGFGLMGLLGYRKTRSDNVLA